MHMNAHTHSLCHTRKATHKHAYECPYACTRAYFSLPHQVQRLHPCHHLQRPGQLPGSLRPKTIIVLPRQKAGRRKGMSGMLGRSPTQTHAHEGVCSVQWLKAAGLHPPSGCEPYGADSIQGVGGGERYRGVGSKASG